MYLSGEPLHVLTLHLVERYRRARPDVPISFSAGVDSRNFAGLRGARASRPITTCTDLLRPGGYGRLPKYLENLEERMRTLGVRRAGRLRREGMRPGPGRDPPRGPGRPAARRAARGAAGRSASTSSACSSRRARERSTSRSCARRAVLNTPVVVEQRPAATRATARSRTARSPRKIGSKLWLFDCINCDKCVPVCPNDANFVYDTAPLRTGLRALTRRGRRGGRGRGRRCSRSRRTTSSRTSRTSATSAATATPSAPRTAGPTSRSRASSARSTAFDATQGPRRVLLPPRGRARRGVGPHPRPRVPPGDRPRARPALFTDGVIRVELRPRDRRPLRVGALPGAAEGHTLDLSAYLNLALAVDGVHGPAAGEPRERGWL